MVCIPTLEHGNEKIVAVHGLKLEIGNLKFGRVEKFGPKLNAFINNTKA